MFLFRLIASCLAALLSTSALAAPTGLESGLAKRDDSILAGLVATGFGTLKSMTGNLIVPTMSVPSGGDPTQLYIGQAFMGMFDSEWRYPLALGIQCFAGSQTGCEVVYEFLPTFPPTALSDFTITPNDLLTLTVTAVSNTTARIEITNVSAPYGSTTTLLISESPVFPAYTDALWIVESGQFVDFNTVAFTETHATTVSGTTVTPDEAQNTYEMSQDGTTLSSVSAASWGVVISYL